MTNNLGLIRSVIVLFVLAAICCIGAEGKTAPATPQITQVTLERVLAGPQPNDLPPDKIVLRRAALSEYLTAPTFDRLAQWLEASGFFSRRSGANDALPFLPDAGTLTITVVRGAARLSR